MRLPRTAPPPRDCARSMLTRLCMSCLRKPFFHVNLLLIPLLFSSINRCSSAWRDTECCWTCSILSLSTRPSLAPGARCQNTLPVAGYRHHDDSNSFCYTVIAARCWWRVWLSAWHGTLLAYARQDLLQHRWVWAPSLTRRVAASLFMFPWKQILRLQRNLVSHPPLAHSWLWLYWTTLFHKSSPNTI